jgi:hypothetical protein
MRLALATAALVASSLCACGGGGTASSPTASHVAPRPVLDAGAEGDAGEALVVASLASLTALGPSLAPGMRESDHAELAGAGELVHELPKFEKDTCVRVTFSASTKVSASLVDASGVVLARVDAVASGWLGERGPACSRPQASPLKIKLHAEGPLQARLVAWSLP